MATVGTSVPPPLKSDYMMSSLDNPRLSPPSPGGPRKAQPPVNFILFFRFKLFI